MEINDIPVSAQSVGVVDCPLVVDMDGTLLSTDTLYESFLNILHKKPQHIATVIAHLKGGKAHFKQMVGHVATIDVTSLPVNELFLNWLREEKARGRTLVLCTAADKRIADEVAAHFGIFDEVIASDGQHNLKGRHKADYLIRRYGEKGFDYAGNDVSDLAVFAPARQSILVNMSGKVTVQARKLSNVDRCFARTKTEMKDWLRLLRIHQWKKNILLLAAPLADHTLVEMENWLSFILAFFSFSFAASFVYIVNDLLDLENDRHHPTKKYRPLACGRIALIKAILYAPFLALVSVAIGFIAGGVSFLSWLLVYFVLTMAYSLGLKKILLLDCVILAILYALRLIAGASILSIDIFSSWLMTFSLFLFLSLAFIKRYSELELCKANASHELKGRGYRLDDIALIQAMGIAAGFLSVLVLALYLNSPQVQLLYPTSQLLWLNLPVLLYWIAYMWMQAHRGGMHEDPVVFATRDKVSLLCGVVFLGVLALGAMGA